MAVAAAIGVGGLDEHDESSSINLIDNNRFTKHLKQKSTDSNLSMHKMVLDTSLKSSDIPMPSSGGIIGEINRSIEKMSLTMEDPSVVTNPGSNQELEHHASGDMVLEDNTASFATLCSSQMNTGPSACTASNTNRRGSDWTTVSTEGYYSMCGSDQISTVASRRPSDISVSSFSQVNSKILYIEI